MSKPNEKANSSIPLTDHRLAAAATIMGGHLQEITQDPTSNRLIFYFDGLPATFVRDAFNGELTVNLRDFIAALDQVMGLIHQFRARRER